MKRVEKPDVNALKESADILLYGQWVPLPPDFLSVKELREVTKDFLDVTSVVGATGRYLLSQDTANRELAEENVVSLIKESARLYVGILHYGLGVDIPSDVLRFLENQGEENGQDR